MKKLLYIFCIACAVVGCARMGQPDGGWYDDDPPVVIGSYPVDQSTNVKAKKITIYFDEFIKLEDATSKVTVSPPQLEMPEINASGKKIVVALQDSLKENTTYTIDFSDAISDNNEGNPLGNYTYSFSTGDQIDTLEVSGYVLDASNLEPVKGIKVGLLRPITLWPFPTREVRKLAGKVKGILSLEINAGQMVEDIRLAVEGKVPVRHFGRLGGIIPDPDEVVDALKRLF